MKTLKYIRAAPGYHFILAVNEKLASSFFIILQSYKRSKDLSCNVCE